MKESKKGTMVSRAMRVAHIREPKGANYLEVIFLESAMIFRLFKDTSAYKEAVKLLKEGLVSGRVLQVWFASLDSEIIVQIQKPCS